MSPIPQIAKPYLTSLQISDAVIRNNFENLIAYFREQNQLLDFVFFEQIFTEAQTDVKVAHGLRYIPRDILVSHISGSGNVTFKYGEFDETYIVLDVSGACRIRFFTGTYTKQQTVAEFKDSDEYQSFATPSALGKLTYDSATAPLTAKQVVLSSGSTRNNYYINPETDDVVLVDCSDVSQTVTLPLAADFAKRLLWIKKTDGGGNTLTIACRSGENLDDTSSINFTTAYGRALIYCDGTHFYRMD
jgi:hypothetical protein